jgi:large subunit ribosomal protein L31
MAAMAKLFLRCNSCQTGVTHPGTGSRRAASTRDDPATITLTGPVRREPEVKNGIHPEYVETTVTCSCGNTFTTRSTAKGGAIHADVCSACHPFYTGKQKILDIGGRVDKFEKRYGKRERSTSAN